MKQPLMVPVQFNQGVKSLLVMMLQLHTQRMHNVNHSLRHAQPMEQGALLGGIVLMLMWRVVVLPTPLEVYVHGLMEDALILAVVQPQPSMLLIQSAVSTGRAVLPT